jgi:putative FmdB family regulatory protein
MPIYDFLCPQCEQVFEKMVKLDQNPEFCPKCGYEGSDFEKLITGTPLPILKGEGWSPVASTDLSRRRRAKGA